MWLIIFLWLLQYSCWRGACFTTRAGSWLSAQPQCQISGSPPPPSGLPPPVKMSDLTPSLFALGWWVLNLYGTHDIHHT